MTQPPADHYPAYRPPSTVNAPRFRDAGHRAASARAFRAGARAYDDARPGYPPEVAALLEGCARVVDVGAGTGKLTASLIAEGREVWAVEPAADMARTLAERVDVPVWRATAEATALADAAVDAVACAQTWHWVDVAAACAELDRVVRPGGRAVLAWNTLDVTDPWVLRLARIMHSGDVLAEGFTPEVRAPWRITRRWTGRWRDRLDTDGIFALTATRSYWLRNGEKVRARVRGNLEWYLFEHTGMSPGDAVELPYRTDAFVLERA
ncbi:class I SAM-dependent methyltransferase [Corynebacterium frankenforstense]|uniref:class I SAM-dependent methyltransferase n=1 Tax=Corynebacterium frankenforstense TaxID=1230998 RepID=UPI00254D6CE9|nr:class I SAM-dependent methyltransferase [Corynebacterium frankenforstense]MDK6260561.1 class I SAM-dependent methyltransferase [Corynebacterium frankenforstense]